MAEITSGYPDKCFGCKEAQVRASRCAAAVLNCQENVDKVAERITFLRTAVTGECRLDDAEEFHISMLEDSCVEAQEYARELFREFVTQANLHCPGLGELIEEPDGGAAMRPCRLPRRYWPED